MVCWSSRCCSQQAVTVMSMQAKQVVLACNRSLSKMQKVADLLLLGSDLRPVQTDTLTGFAESYPNCRELVITRTKGLLVLTGRINEHLYSVSSRWQDIHICVLDMCELVVALTESCAHAAYLLALTYPQCMPAENGIIDAYTVRRANLNVDLCCQQLKQASRDLLTPQVLVTLCSEVNQNLEILTVSCKMASENARDSLDQEQFKLCVKSFSANGSCFLQSIKRFKQEPSETHRIRAIGFCESLVAATHSTATFASESLFTGKPAQFSEAATNAKIAVLGACMSIVSSAIQLCKVIKELAYDNSNQTQRERIRLCIQAVSRASSQLHDAFSQHQAHYVDNNTRSYSQSHNPR